MTTYTRAADVSTEILHRLRTIRIVNGYETEIGRDVMAGRRKIPGDDQPPCLIVLEGGDDVRDQPGRIPLVLISQSADENRSVHLLTTIDNLGREFADFPLTRYVADAAGKIGLTVIN